MSHTSPSAPCAVTGYEIAAPASGISALTSTSVVASYGVRVSRIGAFFAPFGTRVTVWSLTPSRIGIITSRRTWSNASVRGVNCAGVSLGRAG